MTKEELRQKLERDTMLHCINEWIDHFFEPEQANIDKRINQVMIKHQQAYAKEGIRVSLKYAYVGNTMFRNALKVSDEYTIATIHLTVTEEAFDILNQILKMTEDERKVRQYLSILCSNNTEYYPVSNPIKSISMSLLVRGIPEKTKQMTFNPNTDEHKVKPIWFKSFVELDEILMYYFVRRMGVC